MPSNAAKSAGQAEGSSCQSVVSVPRSLVKRGTGTGPPPGRSLLPAPAPHLLSAGCPPCPEPLQMPLRRLPVPPPSPPKGQDHVLLRDRLSRARPVQQGPCRRLRCLLQHLYSHRLPGGLRDRPLPWGLPSRAIIAISRAAIRMLSHAPFHFCQHTTGSVWIPPQISNSLFFRAWM